MKIKICGLTDPSEAEYLNRNSVDIAGTVLFFPESRRNISLEMASEIHRALDKSIKKAAVVVSPDIDEVRQIEQAGFDYIQIHGSIPSGYFSAVLVPVIKAFNVHDLSSYKEYSSLSGIAGYIFDAVKPGSGKTFDWSLAEKLPRDGRPVFLAGGLDSSNVADAIDYFHPDGVDVSSGVEYNDRPGKDGHKIDLFVSAVRSMHCADL